MLSTSPEIPCRPRIFLRYRLRSQCTCPWRVHSRDPACRRPGTWGFLKVSCSSTWYQFSEPSPRTPVRTGRTQQLLVCASLVSLVVGIEIRPGLYTSREGLVTNFLVGPDRRAVAATASHS